jgi:hypothetical protein
MKKLISIFLMAFGVLAVSAQCTIDQSNTQPISPPLDSIPCAERGVGYGPEVVQIYIPSSLSVATIDSIVIDSVGGIPNGLTWSLNPASGVIPGGSNACAEIAGTTSDPAGRYNFILYGTAYVKISGFAQTFPLDQPPVSDQFVIYLDVIEAGAPCRVTTGIREKANGLSISMFPNPNNGVFTLSVKANGNVEISAFDFTGRQVLVNNANVQGNLSTQIDLSNLPKGIYAVRVKSADGVVSKNIMVE